ncbi:MAG: Gfo/Idh/MocA family oxidoreductase [Verrucomicrobiales bacterium]|nr:Gfo/Idh/MocA family oxidoreductase [Verrucomicrobiales bacterium]
MSELQTLRVGLLGAGWFGREAHLRNLVRMPGVEVTVASSRSPESLAAVREIAGDSVQTFADWRQALEAPELDAVIVALTNDQHHEACLRAFERGLHVLCEKPLGLTLAECDDMIAAAEKAGKILQVGHEMRYQRLYQEMKEMMDTGAVGVPRIMWCREYRGPMRVGWRSSEAKTGGLLLEKNCHHLDLFNWLLNAKPTRVMAMGGRDVLTDREVLDNAQVVVEYDGGQRATLEVCLFAPKGGDCEIGVVGEKGRIDTKNQALSLMYQPFDEGARVDRIVPESDEEAKFVDGSGRVDRGIRGELDAFAHSCRTGEKPLNDGASARLSVAICLAAQESIRQGQAVTL